MTDSNRGESAVRFRARTTAGQAPSLQANVEPRRRGGVVFALIVVVLGVGLAATWSLVAHRQLTASTTAEARQYLARAHTAFTAARTSSQEVLQGYCRILVEDPRLKSTLATEGMDAATVADILTDLGKLRGRGFLMVLSPDGKVFAEAGAAELRGLDLSDSTIVKKAQGAADAAVGAWVLGGKVMDLSIMAIRFGDDIVAFLVVGQSVDEGLLKDVAAQTGVQVANALSTQIVNASSAEAKPVLTQIASSPTVFAGRTMSIDSQTYVASVIELGETAQSHRLIVARPMAETTQTFQLLQWLLFVPPLLVLISIMFALSGSRSTRRS